jgi:hypothetical protein
MAGNIATYDIDLVNGGDVSIFMDGKRVDGTWEGSTDAPPRFKDSEGRAILLTPGRTWVNVMPTGENISSSYDGASNDSADTNY